MRSPFIISALLSVAAMLTGCAAQASVPEETLPETVTETTVTEKATAVVRKLSPRSTAEHDEEFTSYSQLTDDPDLVVNEEPETDDTVPEVGETDPVTGETTEEPAPAVTEVPASSAATETAAATTADTSAPGTSESTAQATVSQTQSETTVTEAETTAVSYNIPEHEYDPLVYDKTYFNNDIFVGDSISTGYPLYKYLDAKNVFAKIGLNPSTALTKRVSTAYGSLTVFEMVHSVQPDHVYIMLGSNGIQWLSNSDMTKNMEVLCENILANSPRTKIAVLSIPPITAGYDLSVSNLNVMYKVNCYNADLKNMCEEKGYKYIDICTPLKDTNGYFADKYAEKDGLHFKGAAYSIVLGKVYYEMALDDAEARKAIREAELLKEQEQTETSETVSETTVSETTTEPVTTTESSVTTSETTVTTTVTTTETEPAEPETTSVTASGTKKKTKKKKTEATETDETTVTTVTTVTSESETSFGDIEL